METFMSQSWYRHHHRIILLQSSDYDPDFTMKKLKITDTQECAQDHTANKVVCLYESRAHVINTTVYFSIVFIHLVILKICIFLKCLN